MATTGTAGATLDRRVIEYRPEDVRKMLDEGTARLLDVREADEHRRERIVGSALLPCSAFKPDDVEAGPGVTTILYCRTGRRSLEAARRLLDAGHATAAHLRGGIEAWKAAGLPVAVDKAARMPVMQQTQLAIGLMVVVTALLGAFLSPWFLGLTVFVGGGLIMAGLTGACPMASLIAKAPWNGSCCDSGVCKG